MSYQFIMSSRANDVDVMGGVCCDFILEASPEIRNA